MEEPAGDVATTGLAGALALLRQKARPASTLPECAECPLNTICGGGCRSENVLLTGDGDRAACGEWRVRALSELLAEDLVSAVHWPASHLLAEARARGIDAPPEFRPAVPSRHLVDV
jgi:sulfatase maturation enzyme AslB (radical SAM superfamily)